MSYVEIIRNRNQELIDSARKNLKWKQMIHKRANLESLNAIELSTPSRDISRYRKLLKSKSETNESVLNELRFVLSQGTAYIDEFLNTPEPLQCLIRCLTCNKPKQQWEAAACLTNIACGNEKQSLMVVKACGAYIILFLHSNSSLMQEQCLWLISNLCCDGWNVLSLLFKQGLITALCSCISSIHERVITSALNTSIIVFLKTPKKIRIDDLYVSVAKKIKSVNEFHSYHLICIYLLSTFSSYIDIILDCKSFIEVLNRKPEFINSDEKSILFTKLLINTLINLCSYSEFKEIIFKLPIANFLTVYQLNNNYEIELSKLLCNLSKLVDSETFNLLLSIICKYCVNFTVIVENIM